MSDVRFVSLLVFALFCLTGLGALVYLGKVPYEAAGALLGMAATYLVGGITPSDRVLGLLGVRREIRS